MGARQKLNEVNVLGSLAVAGAIGVVAGSWLVFVVTGAVLIGASIYSGDIRPSRGRRR